MSEIPGRMTSAFLRRFPSQLGHWSLHATLNALPSFIIAAVYLQLWDKPRAMLGMGCAVLVFIVAFATVTSLPGPQAEDSQLIGHSIRLGAKIRSWIACLSLPLLALPHGGFFLVPDFWCGWLACGIQEWIMNQLGAGPGNSGFNQPTFGKIFSLTLLEGLILSVFLLMIAFFSLIILQNRERKRAMRAMAAV